MMQTAVRPLIPETPIWDLDWDILCIADGCRVDTFRSAHPNADAIWSVGSTSQDWIPRTFGPDYDLSSVAYISANPFSPRVKMDRFAYFHLEPVRKASYGVETVTPEALTHHAAAAWRSRHELGIDKMIIQYMQPHAPFRSRPDLFEDTLGTDTWGSYVWEQIRDGDLSPDDLLSALQDNLEWLLEDGIEPLSELVDGTVGITADHGNAAGKWGYYGHPSGVIIPSVRRVPWMTLEATDEGGKIPEINLATDTLSDEQLEKQLEALGYRA